MNHHFPISTPSFGTQCAFALACLTGAGVNAQESIRPSAIGAAAPETRQEQPSMTLSGFTKSVGDLMRFGPVNVNASAQMSVGFTDNVGLSEVNRESDMVFRPSLSVDAEWKVSRLNTMRLGMSLGYAKYLRNPKLDSSNLDSSAFLLDPGTQFSFDMFVGEQVRLNFHDRIQITQNPVDEPTLSDVVRFDRLQNSAGVTAFAKFPNFDVALGYDHFNFFSLTSEFSYLDRAEEQFFASVRRRAGGTLGIGLDGSLALVNFVENVDNDATAWTAGVFCDATFSEYTKLRIAGGYQSMQFDGSGTNGDQSNLSSWYGNLAVTQRIGQYMSHALTVGREARVGLSVNYTETAFARYAATWRMNAVMTWTLNAFVEDAKESGGAALNAEDAFRWGGGASLACRIAERMNLTLGYLFVNKDSNLPMRSYYQNSVALGLNYQF